MSVTKLSAKQHTKEQGQCYLCGNPATTQDHIPPLGIFPKPRPTNLITVPACNDCNGNTTLHDEYFRVVVSATSNDSPNSLTLLHQRIIPRIHKRPGLIKDFLEHVRPLPVYSLGGIYLKQIKILFSRLRKLLENSIANIPDLKLLKIYSARGGGTPLL